MIAFKTATLPELEKVLDWAGQEGWNPGVDDAAAFLVADPDGFFIALKDGRPVAAISVVNHADSFAFLGLYIVRPECRGQGIGYALWQHALEHAGARTIGLDGVPEQQANYAASGFAHAGGTTRFSGHVAPEPCADLRPANAKDIPALIDREAAASGVRKAAYLSTWFETTPNRRTLVGSAGLCTVRRCQSGAKIGPLIATDSASVLRLIRHASGLFDGDVTIDVPDASAAVADACRSLQLSPGFETARMYRGPRPKVGSDLYAVATLELG
ncbi:N-acetyltransferase GCN5 [Roseobacter cerasinus]|uniref:N-acetyltransferase GCN5 n=1 Tax=Roseobacter cerasinus TaxID=2602289 RepID=A0A640VVG6_9RHOB|nr:GNAT family N-acetyltransferase [Roseobacter cerasinus]GFE50226.1 N-acetyltransferase GCN5 [Roseobacter cerasinus]